VKRESICWGTAADVAQEEDAAAIVSTTGIQTPPSSSLHQKRKMPHWGNVIRSFESFICGGGVELRKVEGGRTIPRTKVSGDLFDSYTKTNFRTRAGT